MSVVEVVIVIMLAALVFMVAWNFFATEQERARKDNNRLAGLQGALQLDESLAWDLERIALGLPDGSRPFTVDVPVAGPPDRLEFQMFSPEASGTIGTKSVKVEYRRDAATGRVIRVSDGKERPFPGLVAESLDFQVVPVGMTVGSAADPSQAPFGAATTLHAVRYVVTCISEVMRAGPLGNRREHEKVTLVGAVMLPMRSERAHHPYWRAGLSESLEATP